MPAPLDNLLTGLFAAYSTRLLNSAYTGPLIRLRGGSSTSSAHGWQQAGSPANSGNYFRFDFGTARVVTEARSPQNTYTGTTGNGVFRWQGSNDGSSWTNIGSTFSWNVGALQLMTELNGNTTAYRYYRLLGVSGNLPNNLVWEMEFKIDDNGQTSRIGAPGGQSYQNPGGEGNRASMITVTTTYADGNTEAQRLVNGRYPDAQRSFWPNYSTGELIDSELTDFHSDVSPVALLVQFVAMYDQSGNGRHLEDTATVGQLPGAWIADGTRYAVPNGRFAPQSNANRHFRRAAMEKPNNALYFLEVIQRDNDRPIRDWNFAFGNIVSFFHPVSTANDWTEDNAVLAGNGLNSGAPRAVTSGTYPITDTDAVIWEGGVNASRVGIRRNGIPQALSVASTGYTNEGGTAAFTWPFSESDTNRQVRLCELVMWQRDVGHEDALALSAYRFDAAIAWIDNPTSFLFCSMSDESVFDAAITVSVSYSANFTDDCVFDATPSFDIGPIEGPTLTAAFDDDCWMFALLDGAEIPFVADMYDESTFTATYAQPLPPSLPAQMMVVVTGAGL